METSPSEEAVIEVLTLICEVDNCGNKEYRNKDGDLHRVHGPAVIWTTGFKRWHRNGLPHREDGPAVIYSDGSEDYFLNDNLLSKEEFIQWQKKNGK